MSQFTEIQKEFLQNHNVSLELVFDALGMTKNEYRAKMKVQNKIVAYNVAPCREYGHSLRTRSGHCVQCRPANLAFQKRNDLEGIVYIAGSIIGKIIKVGFSKAIEVRDESLNRTRYAGFPDWQIIFAIRSKSAGQIENKIKSGLKKFTAKINYDHDGHYQESSETFSCSYSKVKSTFIRIIKKENYEFETIRNDKTLTFEFKRESELEERHTLNNQP